MTYPNPFLRDFRPVYFSILSAKGIAPKRAELEVIDEEPEDYSIFEPADTRDVLGQLAGDLNFLTVYTERPAYFEEFAGTMYEETGLAAAVLPKKAFRAAHGRMRPGLAPAPRVVLDFEWEGSGYEGRMQPGTCYIPIHKRPWGIAENLDITVPIGYNTLIIKGTRDRRDWPGRDRFEAAFYA